MRYTLCICVEFDKHQTEKQPERITPHNLMADKLQKKRA
ncbi:hypothetical protein DFP86_1089 [Paludibacterium purpuratum]|uniref:Uncharacterized protein n=1 Tax=Paludibacterium purpuratum TaxID=1144873 RepID=A0A4R7B3C2_9NEIS|nr:hypothetical protein DFP86_1089 [Paludibacterium purpuratum]